jgi:hypothetical protein
MAGMYFEENYSGKYSYIHNHNRNPRASELFVMLNYSKLYSDNLFVKEPLDLVAVQLVLSTFAVMQVPRQRTLC